MAEVDLSAPPPGIGERSEATARSVVFHLAWLVPCVVVCLWFFSSHFQGLRAVDAMDAAQVGRHISEGHGFTTSVVRPLSLAKVPQVANHPDLYNAPLYPLLLAGAFNVLKADDRTVGLVSCAFAVLAILMAYLLGARMLDRWAGALAAALVAFNAGMLRATISGLGITLLAFLVAMLFYLILAHRGSLRWSLACGAVCGLAYLTEYGVLLLALPALALVVLSQPTNRLRHACVFAAAFVIVILPWLVRDWVVAGSPFGTLSTYSVAMRGTSHPLTSLYRASSVSGVGPLAFVAGHYREVARKLLLNLDSLQSTVVAIYGMILVVLLGLSLFVDLGTVAANRAKWGLLIGAGLMGISLAIGQPRFDTFYALPVAVGAVGAAAFVVALRARGLSRRAMAGATAAVLAMSAYPAAIVALPGRSGTKPDTRSFDYLERVLPLGAVVLTDQAWGVAWHSKRVAIWLPEAIPPQPRQNEAISLAEAADATQAPGFQALERAGVKPDAIFLSSGLPSYSVDERLGRWQLLHDVIYRELEALRRGESQGEPWVPPGWILAASLPPRDFVLLREEAARPDARAARREED